MRFAEQPDSLESGRVMANQRVADEVIAQSQMVINDQIEGGGMAEHRKRKLPPSQPACGGEWSILRRLFPVWQGDKKQNEYGDNRVARFVPATGILR